MHTLRNWLEEGPFTLALSSSFFGFYAHCGFVSALYDQGLSPSRITGASAGALVGGALASGLTPKEASEILFRLRRPDFWDPRLGPGYLHGRKFLRILERHFAPSFREAKVPLAVAAFDLFSWKTRFLADGALPAAVVASCAVPFLFHPVRIGRGYFIDGGVFHKSGMAITHSGERILCVFLQGEGLTSAYEWRASLKPLGENQKMVRFRGLPRVSPGRLETGPEAFQETYRRSLKVFDQGLPVGARTWET